MGHVGDAADICLIISISDRAGAADELKHDPHAKHDHRWHGDYLVHEQDIHARLREHEDVGAEHASDRA